MKRDRAHGDRSAEILQALWSLGEPVPVSDVQQLLENSGGQLAYNTVQTLLNRLVDQGKVARERSGRAFLYRPTDNRTAAATAALTKVAERFFGGSRTELATQLVDDLDTAELERVRRMIDRALDEDQRESD